MLDPEDLHNVILELLERVEELELKVAALSKAKKLN